MIKDVHFDPILFDMDLDLLIPTYKKKRGKFLKYYQVRSCDFRILANDLGKWGSNTCVIVGLLGYPHVLLFTSNTCSWRDGDPTSLAEST